ncbi:MAG: FUSC family protein [Flavobacteriaceae bacterium]
MEQKKLDELSNEELLNEAKKMKSTAIINATLIGVLIGVLIYSIIVNKLGFLTLILLFIIYKFANNSNYNKEEIEKLLKERGLK